MANSGKASLKEKLQDDLLSCSICLELFQHPKALPCLHTFCYHCLNDYVRKHESLKPSCFPCPVCWRYIRVPDGGIQEFQDNFLLLSLSDILKEDDVCHNQYQQQLSPPRSFTSPSSLEEKLNQCTWYSGKLSRNACEEWLLSTSNSNGTFLIRQEEAPPKSADGLCCKLTQGCGKPRSLYRAHEREKNDSFIAPRDSVKLLKLISNGQFADVWSGTWNKRDVAVKIQRLDTVKMEAFLDEAQILMTLDHPNIVKLLAVCKSKVPVFLVTEYMAYGRLSLYLRDSTGSELKVTQLLWICAQIADALAYLEKQKFIHRNLGARNVLVGKHNNVKLAGFGMTKFADDPDFNFRSGLKMAIKWMAPEVFLYNKYSTKADVWSFGVLMMEVLTQGQEPYLGMRSKEAFEHVQQGYRMPKPDTCPVAVYDLMLLCWSINPPSRPTFGFLSTRLQGWKKLQS